MSGYAPNPEFGAASGAAPLTASLLARKGEALPAVDAEAHAGVDIVMKAPGRSVQRGGGEHGPRPFEGYPANPGAGARPSNVRAFHPRPANANGQRPASAAAPDNWTLPPPQQKRANVKSRLEARAAAPGRQATVTFKMSARDLIRLRLASRSLEMPCQSILLDALDTYLDANDAAPVTDEDVARETELLIRKMRLRRAVNKS